ncbi:MAG: alkylation response protein AidB-like acyl-CoA dehydrogenase [Halioglobus sp.]|jgi:alkylation response protein AidB-like acyl-CoA dehydrogenase
MDFSYSEEQLEVVELAKKILGDQTEPDRLKVIETQTDHFDEKLWADLAQAGLLGVAIKEEYGGMGFGFETLCLLIEEVGRTVAPVPVITALVSTAHTLQRFASKDINDSYLSDLVCGRNLLSAAMIEPANEDLARPKTRAVKVDGGWSITGVKHCVPLANRAKRVLLTAMSDEGLIALLVDPSAQGVTLNRQQATTPETQFEMILEAVLATEVVAQNNSAEALAQWMFETTAAAYSAMATGLCEKMMRMTASYTSQRHQFGVPVATFQAVGHRAADCFIDVECLRLTSQQAISLLDQSADASEAVLIAKIWTGDATHRVSQASQHLHGGIGVDRDYPLFRYSLWARQIELSCGCSAELTERLGQDIAAEFSHQQHQPA